MADDTMKEIALAIKEDRAPWDRVQIRESANSVTLIIRPKFSEKDYKVIIMEHGRETRQCSTVLGAGLL